VLERGYDAVGVDDIAQRADVARATFYAHYPTKDDLLEILFAEVSAAVIDHVTAAEHADLDIVRASVVIALYEHAETLRDLYLVVLRGAGDGRSRHAYLETVADGALRVFAKRLKRASATPRVPVEAIARSWAGAHVALLHAWLEDPNRPSPQEAGHAQTLLLAHGAMWALNTDDTFILDVDAT
jgi:AcrR family transcriptional regulator